MKSGEQNSLCHCKASWRIGCVEGIHDQFWLSELSGSWWNSQFRKYLAPLAGHLLSSAGKLPRNTSNFIFQQDNLPCHTSNYCANGLKTTTCASEWPAQSLDMSPIENLRQDLREPLRRRRPGNKDQLERVFFEWWEKITPERSRLWLLLANMPARTAAVYAAKGLFAEHCSQFCCSFWKLFVICCL